MLWPIFDHLWGHESYQAPLPSDMISDLTSSRKTIKLGKTTLYKTNKQFLLNSLTRSTFNSRCFNIRKVIRFWLTLLDTFFSVFDHIRTQDSSIYL